MHRNPRTRHPGALPGWGPAPGWGQPFPGWSPLIDHGPLPVRVAGLVARWWWPTLVLAGFGAVVGIVLGHDHPGPGLSIRGLLTIALAALVVVLLTVHRGAGPRRLARAAAEYTVVALLAGLLTLAGGVDQLQNSPASAEVKHAATADPNGDASEDRPGVLRVAAGVLRAVTKAIRAVTGAAGWLADLWRQADTDTDHPNPPPPTTAPAAATALSPALASTSTRRPL